MFALLFLLIAIPVIHDLSDWSSPTLRLLAFSVVLLSGVWSLHRSRVWFAAGMCLVVIGVILNVLALNLGTTAFTIATLIAFFLFLLLTIIIAGQEVVMQETVNTNRLVGAICVYLLLGALWALAYEILQLVDPGAFRSASDTANLEQSHEWLYYSFVTLTTLGYGDVVPISATARAMAYMEAIFGQFYIAILVAGLVSAYLGSRQAKTGS